MVGRHVKHNTRSFHGDIEVTLKRNCNAYVPLVCQESGSKWPCGREDPLFLFLLSKRMILRSTGRNARIIEERATFIFIWFVRLLAQRPLLAYCASLG
jgi:hypothetical protein